MKIIRHFRLDENTDGSTLFVIQGKNERSVWHGKPGARPNSRHLTCIMEATSLDETHIAHCIFTIECRKEVTGHLVSIEADGVLVFQGRRRGLPRVLNHLKAKIDAALATIPQPQARRMY